MIRKEKLIPLLEKIDAELREEGWSIPNRSFHAVDRVAKELKTQFISLPVHIDLPSEGMDSGTLAFIERWYRNKYGARAQKSFSHGTVVITIRNEPWRLTLPTFFGTAKFVCDPESTGGQPSDKRRRQVGPVINVFNLIEDFTEMIANELSSAECDEILAFTTFALNALQLLGSTFERPFIREVFAELDAAVYLIMADFPHFGYSKWASWQVIEKVLKSFLKIRGVSFKKSHDLPYLSILCGENGMDIDFKPLREFKGSSIDNLRYGEGPPVRCQEAIRAHHASLQLIERVAPFLSKKS